MEMTEAFLDSTAVAARILADRRTFPLLMKKLRSYSRWTTSQYVLMEISRGLIRNLVFLYHSALDASSYGQVLARIETLLSTPRRYLPRTMLQNLRISFEEIQNTKLKDAALHDPNASISDYALRATTSLLRMRIRNCWSDLHSFLDTVINELNCYPELEGPKQVGNRFDATFPFCETLNVPCNVSAFVEDHRSELENILIAISQSPTDRETEARINAVQSILRDTCVARKHKTCWYLGDALVCLEAPRAAHVVNDNARHMDAICEALDKHSVHWR